MSSSRPEKRNFLRHPINVPILISEAQRKKPNTSTSLNVSQGGLCFFFTERLSKGTPVKITIPVKEKRFRIRAKVVYSEKDGRSGFFKTGVSFVDYLSAFQAKLAEEMLEILEYRKKMARESGRDVSEEEAAKKWIGKFSKFFPKFFQEAHRS